MNIKKTIYIISIIWLLIISIWTTKNEIIFSTGREVILKTKPVSPQNIFEKEYINLDYEISEYTNTSYDFKEYKNGDIIFTRLHIDKNNSVYAHDKKGKYINKYEYSELYIKGELVNCHPYTFQSYYIYKPQLPPNNETGLRCTVKYGIENYYVKEGTGLELQKKLRNGGLVKVSIDKHGNAKIKGFVEK